MNISERREVDQDYKGSCWKVFGTHYPSSTGYAEFIKQITVLIKKWNVVDQGNEILKDFHGYR